jgi:maltose O-acetyltransferase
MTEREKMLAGEPYDPLDPDLTEGRNRARATMARATAEPDPERRQQIYASILGAMGERAFVEAPLFCDYGTYVLLGDDCFLNTGCVLLDCAPITLGDRVQVGPAVQLLAADHPREAALRAADVEFARPVTIGADVWLGAGSIVCPGVSVGEGTVIGAGSVVVRDVPAAVVAAGNPCRVIRELG